MVLKQLNEIGCKRLRVSSQYPIAINTLAQFVHPEH